MRGNRTWASRYARAFYSAVLACFLFGAHSALTPATAAARPDTAAAQAFIESLADQAATALQGDGSLAEREARLRSLLRDGFAIDLIARLSLGKHWRRLSDSVRDDYKVEFGEFLLRTYASRLGRFERDSLEVTDAVPRGKKDVVVRTDIAQPSGPPVNVGWRIRMVADELRIIDIVVEGVSMALNQRQEFSKVISRDGITGLMEMLRARVERLPVEGPEK